MGTGEGDRQDPRRRSSERVQRRWRDYVAPGGGRPVRAFIAKLRLDDRAVIAAAMREVRVHGTKRARHLRGDVYEVRAFAANRGYRILFAEEGRLSQVLLGLHAIKKQTQPTPPAAIALAERRLHDWRERGRAHRRGRLPDMPNKA